MWTYTTLIHNFSIEDNVEPVGKGAIPSGCFILHVVYQQGPRKTLHAIQMTCCLQSLCQALVSIYRKEIIDVVASFCWMCLLCVDGEEGGDVGEPLADLFDLFKVRQERRSGAGTKVDDEGFIVGCESNQGGPGLSD